MCESVRVYVSVCECVCVASFSFRYIKRAAGSVVIGNKCVHEF